MFQETDDIYLHGFFVKPRLIPMIELYTESQIAQNSIILMAQSSYWVVRRISDYSQNIISINIQNCANVKITTAELQAFSYRPRCSYQSTVYCRSELKKCCPL
jgi:hypothetical protein